MSHKLPDIQRSATEVIGVGSVNFVARRTWLYFLILLYLLFLI